MSGCSIKAEGLVKKQIDGRGFYARVSIEFHKSTAPSVIVAPSAQNDGLESHGWLKAAIDGAFLGMKLARITGSCTITRVHGMVCDTNPTVVVIAAARAVWNAASFVPDDVLAERAEQLVIHGHATTPSELEKVLCP